MAPPEVMAASDFAGSTAALADYVQEKRPAKVVLLTECSMSDNVAAAAPDLDFIRPCNLCPHMKRITLEAIYVALVEMKHEVIIPEDVRLRAKRAIDRMLALPKEKPRAFETGRAPVAVASQESRAAAPSRASSPMGPVWLASAPARMDRRAAASRKSVERTRRISTRISPKV